MRQQLRALGPSIIAILAVLLLGACGNTSKLDAARALAQTATIYEPEFSAIAADYYASCVRTYNWTFGVTPDQDKLKFQSPAEWCADAYAAAQQWQKTNAVLLSYLKGLGALAGGQGNDYGIPALVNDIAALNNTTKWFDLSPDAANGIASFGAWVTQAYFAGKRASALGTVVPGADPYVQNIVRALQGVATNHYGAQYLWLELHAVDLFYDQYLLNPPSAPNTLSAREQWINDRQAVAARYAGISAYVDALDRIAKAHTALVAVLTTKTFRNNEHLVHTLDQGIFIGDMRILRAVYHVRGGAK